MRTRHVHGMCTVLCIAYTPRGHTKHTCARAHTHPHCTISHAVLLQNEELLRRGGARGAALPLLVVVNQGAGAKLGAVVAEALSQRSADVAAAGGTMRVVDVADTTPREALRAFASEHTAYRVLVCGGDGTVTWVLAAIEELLAEAGGEAAGGEAAGGEAAAAAVPYRPAVGILPLGTGNDLARVLGWGKSFRRERMLSQLAKLDRSRIAALDRWKMCGSLPEGRAETRLCNYCSIGVDAKAALLWARLSKARPELFKLRLLNKLWYIICGTPEFALHSFSDLHAHWFEMAPARP
jgi:diacylglycerol kinase (ATP)